MEKNRGDIRKLLKYKFLLGHKAIEAVCNINRAYGDGTVKERTAQQLFSKFRSGNLAVEDNPRSGRPREIDRVAVVNAVEEHPSMTIRMLAEDFDCSHVWSTHPTAPTFLQTTTTYFAGSEERDSPRSKRCASPLLNPLILRVEIGTARASINSKSSYRK
uniref:Mos1 transposase HTH domain-containing protein n=1 Tax=Acrobeloides nanus TaxID=290746 RepID=A0A914D7K3_9BILA